MANEITFTISMSRQHVTVTADSHTFPVVRKLITQTGTGQDDRKHTIGTSEESITFTDIPTNGYCILQNLDATNYVEWGGSTGVYVGRMKAGETAGPFRINPGAILYLRANTAACKVRIIHYED